MAYLREQRGVIARLTGRHIQLVAISLLVAIVIAIPLGLGLERVSTSAEGVIRAVGVLQTLPGIALLAFMIPLLGIGVVPALVALVLYSLYPIVRNTYTGVRDADPSAVSAARALGMTDGQVLRQVRLAAGRARDHGGGSHGGRDRRWHGNTRGVHRCRWTGRADRGRPRPFRHAHDSFRSDSCGAARHRRRRRTGDRGTLDPTRPVMNRERLIEQLEEARARTLHLVEPLSSEDLHRQHDPLMSPIMWDLGHIAHFEELWLVRNLDGPVEFGEMPGIYNPVRASAPRARRTDAAFRSTNAGG